MCVKRNCKATHRSRRNEHQPAFLLRKAGWSSPCGAVEARRRCDTRRPALGRPRSAFESVEPAVSAPCVDDLFSEGEREGYPIAGLETPLELTGQRVDGVDALLASSAFPAYTKLKGRCGRRTPDAVISCERPIATGFRRFSHWEAMKETEKAEAYGEILGGTHRALPIRFTLPQDSCEEVQ